MTTVGIIAEYNPLHNGHVRHLQEARRRSGADLVVVVMSTAFVQRGEPALLCTADRVRIALEAGADAVFGLPALWAVRDAEHFALGGVHILRKLGCDAISFGSEQAEGALMQHTAELLEDNGPALQDALQTGLRRGIPYPEAIAIAAEQLLPGSGKLLSSPNSTLGICYLRAIRRLRTDMEAIIIPRNSGYHDTTLSQGSFPSATAVRLALMENRLPDIQTAVPESVFRLLEKGTFSHPHGLDQALMYRLLSMTDADYTALPGISEGIQNRLRDAARSAASREDLLARVKTRRYPYARLSRLCAHALLQLTEEEVSSAPLPDCWLLGMKPAARPLLRQATDQGTRILSRAGDLDPNALWVRTETLASNLWSLAAGQSVKSLFSQRLITLDE